MIGIPFSLISEAKLVADQAGFRADLDIADFDDTAARTKS